MSILFMPSLLLFIYDNTFNMAEAPSTYFKRSKYFSVEQDVENIFSHVFLIYLLLYCQLWLFQTEY